LLEVLCKVQCTREECAAALDVAPSTLDERIKEETGSGFQEFYKKYSLGGKTSLRRAQYKKALEGNTAIQIWLGKQYLGQADKHDLDAKVKTETVIVSQTSKMLETAISKATPEELEVIMRIFQQAEPIVLDHVESDEEG
jgi:hypothetical protein